MRVTKPLNVANLVLDRMPINPHTLALVDYIRQIGYTDGLPPIHVRPQEDGSYLVLDGRHRVTAFKLLGLTYIMSRFYYNGPNP